jgi:6-phosphogluconolactonase (cycloisomerase 2 family)
MDRGRLRRASMALCLALSLAVAHVPANAAGEGSPSLSQLPGDAGCLKGFAGFSWIPCDGSVRGEYDVESLAVSPDGKFAYAVSMYSGYSPRPGGGVDWTPGGTIVAFARDAATGSLNQLAGDDGCVKDIAAPTTPVTAPCHRTARGLNAAKAITLSPDGRFAYVAAIDSDAIAAFRRDVQTGALSQLPGRDACIQDEREAAERGAECPTTGKGLHGVRWLRLSPDGRNLYAASGASEAVAAFSVDRYTGALRQLSGRDACIEDRLARRRGLCPAQGVGLNYPRSLTVSPDGENVYVTSDSSDRSSTDPGNGDAISVFARDRTTGALRQLPGSDACIRDRLSRPDTGCTVIGKGLFQAFAVVVSPDGRHVYVGSNESNLGAVAGFERNTDTGALRQLGGDAACIGGRTPCRLVTGIKGADAVTMSPGGRYLYVAAYFGHTVAGFERDGATGRLQPLSGNGRCVENVGSSEPCPVSAKGLLGPRGVVFSPDGKSAYVPTSVSGTVTVFSVSGDILAPASRPVSVSPQARVAPQVRLSPQVRKPRLAPPSRRASRKVRKPRRAKCGRRSTRRTAKRRRLARTKACRKKRRKSRRVRR